VAASCVVKLIPTYFDEVGAVSGLAKSAGAACGFAMTSLMAVSTDLVGSFVPAFAVWTGMNALALWLVGTRRGIPAPATRTTQPAPLPVRVVAPSLASGGTPDVPSLPRGTDVAGT
jgi:NNP family nitrate/nitrite transporter-like MFS transporter